MKINEVVKSLEESFGDLRTVLSREIDAHDGDISITLRRMAQRSGELSDVASGIPKVSPDAGGMLQLIRAVVRHPLLPGNLQRYRNTGTWIRMIKEHGVETVVGTVLSRLLDTIVESASSPQRQKPEITPVARGDGWRSFQLHNWAAAREVCKRFKTNFCIGASDTQWFSYYGAEQQRDTFAIIVGDRAVIVHAGKNGFLITSHDNENDVTHNGREKGRGVTAIVDDLGDPDTAVEAIKSVVPQRHHERLEEIFQEKSWDYMKFVTQDPTYEVQAYEFGKDGAHGIRLVSNLVDEFTVSVDENTGDIRVKMSDFDSEQTSSSGAWRSMRKFLSSTVDEEDINRIALGILDIFADDAGHSGVHMLAIVLQANINKD